MNWGQGNIVIIERYSTLICGFDAETQTDDQNDRQTDRRTHRWTDTQIG